MRREEKSSGRLELLNATFLSSFNILLALNQKLNKLLGFAQWLGPKADINLAELRKSTKLHLVLGSQFKDEFVLKL